MVLENAVVIGVGDEQVVTVLAGLVMGAAGDLEREAKAIDGLVDELEGLGAQLFGMVERVGNRAQRNPGLARDVADFYLCHSGPFDAFQVQARL